MAKDMCKIQEQRCKDGISQIGLPEYDYSNYRRPDEARQQFWPSTKGRWQATESRLRAARGKTSSAAGSWQSELQMVGFRIQLYSEYLVVLVVPSLYVSTQYLSEYSTVGNWSTRYCTPGAQCTVTDCFSLSVTDYIGDR